ncbi:centrosomal protein 43-like isoform X2 [Anthonomus grandis grandis]|uniref:centrosomal protein 43-like isoform X2 n=1 Tax=Anthonomus grandis grandis TaxID=2921223 RepID=UPI0021657FF7|nr:centrosomal protein 43-like isoform X2 [Anthonomus grandis grandis]
MVEEDVELVDLLAQTLEKSGCLAKIKAELRASTFLALEEDLQLSQKQPLKNLQVKSYLETPEGQIMFSLVQEFLEFFNLQFTLAVYEPESYRGTYKSPSRQELIKDLGLSNEPTVPLLQQLLKIAQTKNNRVLDINLNLNGSESSIKRDSGGPFNKTYEVNSPVALNNNKNSLQGIIEEPPSISDLNDKCVLNKQDTYEDTSSIAEDCESLKSDVPILYKSASSSLKSDTKHSTNDILPPLYADFKSKTSNLKDLGTMFDNEVNYEDDFNESESVNEQDSSAKVDLLNMVNKKKDGF